MDKAIKKRGWAKKMASKILPMLFCTKESCYKCINQGRCLAQSKRG